MRIRLYPNELKQGFQLASPENINRDCVKCPLAGVSKTVCMPAEGRPGGLYVIGEYPTQSESQAGRGFTSKGSSWFRGLLQKHWKGPIAFDHALRCAPGKAKFSKANIAECQTYTAGVIQDVRPTRILALGQTAFQSVLNRSMDPFSVRGGYSWLRLPGDAGSASQRLAGPSAGPVGDEVDVPVFLLPSVRQVIDNRFYLRWFEEDLQRALTADPPKPPVEATTTVVTTVADALDAQMMALSSDWVAYDCETVGLMFNPDFHLTSVALAFPGTDQTWVWDETALRDPKRVEPLIQVLTDPGIGKTGQNVKYDLKAIRCGFQNMLKRDVVVGPVTWDTRLMRKLLATGVDASLGTMGELVGMGGHKDEAHHYVKEEAAKLRKDAAQVRKTLRMERKAETDATKSEAYILAKGDNAYAYAYGAIPHIPLMRYNALDTLTTTKLAEKFAAEMELEPEQLHVWNSLVGAASEAFAQIESWGMPVDKNALLAFIQHLEFNLKKARTHIASIAGPDFNPASVKQMRELLFKKLKLRPLKETKTGAPSTDAETLNHLKFAHPIVKYILEERRLSKMLGTYGYGMLPHIRSDGRIHCTYNLDGARSGRLSSDDPNLQNIPRAESVEGKMARDIFKVPKGYLMVQVDYSQLELRIAADISGDVEMRKIFEEGVDYHQRTAEMIAPMVWGIKDPSQVTKKHRSGAKAFNFGILYGMSDAGIASRAGCSIQEAQTIRRAILGKFAALDKWTKSCLSEAKKTGYTWTYWDGKRARRRGLWDIGWKDTDQYGGKRSIAEHGSWNTPVQGTASDYCLASAVALTNWILESGFEAMVIGTVHDSIMFQVREDKLQDLITKVREIMEGWPTAHDVPIEVDVEVGHSWGSLQKWENCMVCGEQFWQHGFTFTDSEGVTEEYPVCEDQTCQKIQRAALLLKNSGQ